MDNNNVFITDDHQIIINGLKSILTNVYGIQIAGEALNGARGLEFFNLLPVLLVLMEIDIPVINGMEVTRKIKEKYPDINVIILSMHNEGSLVKN